MRISVIGGSRVDSEGYESAHELGRLLAERGHTVVCGGYGGVMEAVCRGAREADGETIGILGGETLSEGNEYLTTPIATDMGDARNALVVLNGEACIAVEGAAGTLSELAMAVLYDRPVAGLETHDIGSLGLETARFQAVESPLAAVDRVEAALR